MLALLIFSGLIWWACGVIGFIYHETGNADFKVVDIPFALFAGLLGGVVILWIELCKEKVLFKRRR